MIRLSVHGSAPQLMRRPCICTPGPRNRRACWLFWILQSRQTSSMPRSLKMDARRFRRLASILIKQRKCPFCGWFGFRFEPFGNKMTYREDALCPICGSLERHRAALLLVRDRIPLHQKTLHVAPEPLMVPWLVSRSCEYLNIDLYNPAMRRMDLMQMELASESKTLVWCSH